jgi:hypothetical protein
MFNHIANGKILIRKLDLMGYTPETQVYMIQNGGGAATFHFLKKNTKHLVQQQYMGQIWHSLPAGRIEKFKDYATSQGFEVVHGEPV